MKGNKGSRCWSIGLRVAGGIEMVPPKNEETLHIYIRRHFERVSKGTVRQFAEQREVTKVSVVVPDARPTDA